MLQELGLSPAAEAIYQAMLSEPRLGIARLCERLALTEHEVRAGLDDLVRFTLLRESRDEPGQLRTVPPEVGLQTLLKSQEEELARRQQELAAARTEVAKAVAEYARLGPDTPVGGARRLLGLDAIQAQLEILARHLTSECLSVMPGGAQSQASLVASHPLDQDALARGISLLTLYQDNMRGDPQTHTYARWLTELGGQVRTAPVVPPRMLIFDREVAVIPIDPTNSRLGALCTTEAGFVTSLTVVFDQAWAIAIPLGADVEADIETGLTPIDQELLKLLASGLTDETAGRRLGVSARTVRRQMAALMERLGAASRFEAGLKAAQRGWLLSAASCGPITRQAAAEIGNPANRRPLSRIRLIRGIAEAAIRHSHAEIVGARLAIELMGYAAQGHAVCQGSVLAAASVPRAGAGLPSPRVCGGGVGPVQVRYANCRRRSGCSALER